MEWLTAILGDALVNTISTWFGFKSQEQLNKETFLMQAKHNKEMAKIEQGYTRDNMHLQASLNDALAIENWKRNEQSAVNAHERNLQMYNQTQSTQAKVREMESTGLSVGMLNGTPSQGGASSGGTAQGQAGQVGLASAQVQPAVLQRMDVLSVLSDIYYKSAMANKINKEAEKIGIENNFLEEEKTEALNNLKEQTNKLITENIGEQLKNGILEIQKSIDEVSKQTDIELRKTELQKALKECAKLQADTNFTNDENARKEELQTLEFSLKAALIRESVSQAKLNKQLSVESAKRIDKLINNISIDTEKWQFEKGDFKNDAEKQQKYMDIYKEVSKEIMAMQLDSAEKQALIHAIGNGISSALSALGNITGAGIIKGLFQKEPKRGKIGY